MAVINITREHNLTLENIKSRINAIAFELEEQYQLKSEWEDNCLFFRRKGASGSIELDTKTFELNLTLGTMFKVAKHNIEKEITTIVDEQL
jgi:putative polyhydroxyalkanoate system protein